jgi:hypothetical protein
MKRWLLALAAAALTFPVHAGENEAEKWFRQAEKNLLAAKTVRVEFDLKTGKNEGGWEGKGLLVLGEGDLARIDGKGSSDSLTFKEPTRIGDGRKVHTFRAGEKPEVDGSPKGLGKTLRGLLTRPGILMDFNVITRKNAATKTFKASQFKLGPKDKIGDMEAQIIEYTVRVEGSDKRSEIGPKVSLWMGGPMFGFPVKKPVEVPVKLWIDTKAGAAAKMEIRWAPAVAESFREYTESLRFTIDPKVDKKLFEPPK